MGGSKKLPVGIEDFEKIRTEGFYYVDKTGLIKELLDNWGEVNLFTRPRRFGKSLNMSMLKYFFGYGCDGRLFDGLEIAKEEGLCRKYMGKIPVVSISLKDVGSADYKTSRGMLCSVIGNEALRFSFLRESGRLSEDDKSQYGQLVRLGGKGEPAFVMEDEVLIDGLLTLSRLLYRHYGQKVILLIDEYDVPLDKAQHFNYYDDMVELIKKLFSRSLKGNDSLYFAVLTGCLRIAKESIFTGLNNFNVMSITNVPFDEHFGFSDKEVQDMLGFYGCADKYGSVKEWYDGYRFGNTEIYCPWDVINYVNLIRTEPDAFPKPFWINTSSNDIIRRFLRMAKQSTKGEIERLVNGESVTKTINQELTYRDLYKNIDNLWSVLFTTGYLTQREKMGEEMYRLAIPNYEVRKIFVEQILEWTQEEARKDTLKLDVFCSAFEQADIEAIEKGFNGYLQKTISVRDTCGRNGKKENFYHGILLGLLSHREDWDIVSNAESGEGFSDILVGIEEKQIGIVIEVKYPGSSDLGSGCREALRQIEKRGYEMRLRQNGMSKIIKYGIACRKKSCKVECAVSGVSKGGVT